MLIGWFSFLIQEKILSIAKLEAFCLTVTGQVLVVKVAQV